MTVRARFLGLGVVVALAAALAFTGVAGHAGGTALVVGDSLVAQSHDAIDLTLRAGRWEPTVEGRSGSSIVGDRAGVDWSTRAAELVAPGLPDVVVVGLGTNDRDEGSESLEVGIDELLRPLRDVGRVVWMNVKEEPFGGADATIVNESLRQATVRWSNLEVLDVSGHFAGHDEWLSQDGVHLSDAGEVEMARLVRRALDSPPSRVGALSPA